MSLAHDPRPGTRVLLIEPDPLWRARLSNALEDGGFVVQVEEGMAGGLESIEAHPPSVALVGSNDPGGDVAKVWSRLQAHAEGRQIPIVFLARVGQVEAVRRAREAGASDFLVLPLEPALIVERVHVALSERAGEAEVERGHSGPGANGLTDRQEMIDGIEQAAKASEAHGHHVAVMYLDLNQFKALSGALPKQTSDLLIQDVARRLRDGVRDGKLALSLEGGLGEVVVARAAPDAFSLAVHDLPAEADAVELGKRVLEVLAEPFVVDRQELYLTVSIGLACSGASRRGGEELLKCAETAAYCARQQGRNTVLSYSPAMDTKAFERMTLETGLRRALERQELLVHYQPRVEIATGSLLGFEALLRWRHPELGLVAPGQFIPLAEETGLIVPIGEWVLKEACAQNKRWQESGLPHLRMAVNLSSVQFRQSNLFQKVADTLDRVGLDPRYLELELTESLLMQNPEAAVQTLQRFSCHGVGLSIDDFGTGYSSLSYLKRFPIDALKIDRTFIRELTTNPDDAAIATSIILMGKSLKLRVVAEGVETRSQLAFLRVMQCHEAQGYLFSPPVPASEAERLIRRGGPLLEAA